MTPAARIVAAIGILDRFLAGEAAEAALIRWSRASRFAGSGDRAAVRDLVYDALRRLRSLTALAGSAEPSGRALMIGALRESGREPAGIFDGAGHAPAPLGPHETVPPRPPSEAERLDLPDWLLPRLRASLGDSLDEVAARLRDRAPLVLRVNAARAGLGSVQAALAMEGVDTVPHPLLRGGLLVTAGERRFAASSVFLDGLAEVQDAGPQAACERLEVRGKRVLDYCAGGGGKALALAAGGARVSAHDAAPERMRDLERRARRAKVRIPIVDAAGARSGAPWDVVVLDVPCSGSGTWRRTPEAKWRLTEPRLLALTEMQAAILDEAAPLVADGGSLVYMTCSLLDEENGRAVRGLVARDPGWRIADEQRFTPVDGADGFYLARLTRI